MTAPLHGTVRLREGMAFGAVGDSGHVLTLDASPDVGGANGGARPMELLLLGLGGCTGMDVISLLRKMRQAVTAYRVELAAERAADHPRVMTTIVVTHVVSGRGLDPAKVRRAVELSATRYCPASAMLSAAAPITHHYLVIDDGTGQQTAGEL